MMIRAGSFPSIHLLLYVLCTGLGDPCDHLIRFILGHSLTLCVEWKCIWIWFLNLIIKKHTWEIIPFLLKLFRPFINYVCTSLGCKLVQPGVRGPARTLSIWGLLVSSHLLYLHSRESATKLLGLFSDSDINTEIS